jgi:DNA-directed RNA polymerase subunit RPC12/RpoP
MTRKEFIFSKWRHNLGIVLPVYIILIAMVALPLWWEAFQEHHPDTPLASRIAGHVTCIGVFVFGLWFLVFAARHRWERQYRCPHCHESFAATEEYVLSSGKCSYCGFKIIEDIA